MRMIILLNIGTLSVLLLLYLQPTVSRNRNILTEVSTLGNNSSMLKYFSILQNSMPHTIYIFSIL
jgi:hypothetical protein